MRWRHLVYGAVYGWPFWAGVGAALVVRSWTAVLILLAAIILWWAWAIWFVSFSEGDRALRGRLQLPSWRVWDNPLVAVVLGAPEGDMRE